MKCVRCNKDIDNSDLYCGYCGINQEKFKKYIVKVSKNIHQQRDNEYNYKIKQAENKLNQLETNKQNEINEIEKSRWQVVGNKNFSYNDTEGKVKINSNIYYFTDIKGAEIIQNNGYKTITNTTGTNNEKSKKHASLGGAVAGGVLFGAVGAVVGGATLGKTTKTGQNNQVTTSNEIPVCYHLGVNVNIKGYNTEIVLLSSTVEQSDFQYFNNLSAGQIIVETLRNISSKEVPKKFIKSEDEQSVLDFNPKIDKAKIELEQAINNKPNYDIPESYYK